MVSFVFSRLTCVFVTSSAVGAGDARDVIAFPSKFFGKNLDKIWANLVYLLRIW